MEAARRARSPARRDGFTSRDGFGLIGWPPILHSIKTIISGPLLPQFFTFSTPLLSPGHRRKSLDGDALWVRSMAVQHGHYSLVVNGI